MKTTNSSIHKDHVFQLDARWILSLAFAAQWLASGAWGQALETATPPRPNMVIFLADDLSVKDCVPYGGKDIPTPNIAALAGEGMVFDRAYVASPSCAPSRAALLTGLFPVRNGAMFNQQKPRGDLRKWPAYFQALGYEVVAIGKVAHYAQVTAYGFDHTGFYNYHQDICVSKAVEWLSQRHSDKPLCLFVGTNWPHVPWPVRGALPPEGVLLPAKIADTPETRWARSRYASAVENADRDLGQVREAVKRCLPADTLFLFSSDHGSQFPFAKWNLYEAGLHTPLVAVWPGHIQPGQRTDALVSWVDLLPTLLEAAGTDLVRAAPDIDGRSFLPVLLGRATTHRERIFATHSGDGNINYYPSRALREGEWKYIRNLDPKLAFHTHVDLAPADTGYWPSWVQAAPTQPAVAALVEQYHHRPAEELYNLAKDPDERSNLAGDAAHAGELQRAREDLDEWMRAQGDHGIATDAAMRPKVKPDPATPDP